jgi:hypothetical protein
MVEFGVLTASGVQQERPRTQAAKCKGPNLSRSRKGFVLEVSVEGGSLMISIISLGATMGFDDLKSTFGFQMAAYLSLTLSIQHNTGTEKCSSSTTWRSIECVIDRGLTDTYSCKKS